MYAYMYVKHAFLNNFSDCDEALLSRYETSAESVGNNPITVNTIQCCFCPRIIKSNPQI